MPLDSQPPAARKWLRRLLWLAAFCFLLSVFCFVFRAPLLTGLANAWIINNPVTHADAIIVLGGGLEYRPFAAARIYSNLVHQSTLNPQRSTPNSLKVLITQPELPPTAQMGLTVPEFVIARQVLLSNGVPASAIQMIGTNVTSTRDEALAVRAWVTDHASRFTFHAPRIIIPTDIFHIRCVRWIFERALRNNSAEVCVMAIDPHRYKAGDWWKHEEGLVAFQNEIIKSAYYHLKY
jgi:uncharacterized SAM-binding protein YcdF (DUF218 family)